MDLKKEFFQRKIKQESEIESYSNLLENYSISNNLNIKFEEVSYSDVVPEDEIESTLKAINGESSVQPPQLKECKTLPLTKNLDGVELISNEQICRLCAQPITNTEIFLYEDGDLEQKITYTLPITMGLGDGLPEYICRNCEVNLNMFYEFVCQVVNADKTIRQKINPPDDVKNNAVTNAVIKEIFGTDEELEDIIKAQRNDQDSQFDKKTNSGVVDVGQLLLEDDGKKHEPNMRLYAKRTNKIVSDDGFKPRKIRILNPKQYYCQLCNETFPDYFALEQHKTTSHQKIRYSCPEDNCNLIFFTQKYLRKHINEHHNVPVICCKCGKIFENQPALEKHHDNFHSLKVCDHCGMSFKSLISFEMHKNLHEKVGKFQCPYCFKNFKNRHEIHRHTRQQHSGKFALLVDMNEDDGIKNGRNGGRQD